MIFYELQLDAKSRGSVRKEWSLTVANFMLLLHGILALNLKISFTKITRYGGVRLNLKIETYLLMCIYFNITVQYEFSKRKKS